MGESEGMDTSAPRRLSVGSLRPRDVVLEIDGIEYEIRGQIPVEGMISLLMIHKRLQALEGTSDDDALKALQAVEEANQIITSMIRDKQPDAVIPRLGVTEVTGILGFIVGNDGGPIAEVEEALVAGVPAPSEEEIQRRIDEAVALAVRKANGEDVPDPTTPSMSDSSTLFSGLESGSSGPQNGGSVSPGLPSEPTASE